MAQIVLITASTARLGQEVGDIVSIHDDDVDLSGPAYKGFQIVRVKASKDEILQIMHSIRPEKKEIKFWKNPSDANWYVLKSEPKFEFSLKNLSTETPSLTDISRTIQEKISTQTDNLSTKSVDIDSVLTTVTTETK